MIFWGAQWEYPVAFDDLLFMKFSGHCHYFQKEELKLSLIILAAKSDYIGGNLFSFQIRKYPQMCYQLHCVARAGLELIRKTRWKQQLRPPCRGEMAEDSFLLKHYLYQVCVEQNIHSGTNECGSSIAWLFYTCYPALTGRYWSGVKCQSQTKFASWKSECLLVQVQRGMCSSQSGEFVFGVKNMLLLCLSAVELL